MYFPFPTICPSVCLSVCLSLSLSLSSFKSAVGFPNWMNGADPLVSVTISAALGIIVVGMAIAYLINKWRRKDNARSAAQNGKCYELYVTVKDPSPKCPR